LIDYILTVAVSIAAGTAALTSAYPGLYPHRVLISNAAIFILMVMNLRGVRESGAIFASPTYLFIAAYIAMFVWIGFDVITNHPIHGVPLQPSSLQGVGLWLVLVAFANGCSALTGVEAISNGVTAFKQPEQRNAKVTLAWMGVILAFLFLGVTYFAHVYDILPRDQETLVSQLARHTNNHWFYLLIQASTAMILFLAANTSFNGFPLVTSLLAEDRYLPRQLASRGDRLVFSNGILALGFIAMFLIWAFQAEVNHLIPVYALGVFLCFTLSQFGMVKHWLNLKGPGWVRSAIINSMGGIVTGVALLVIVATKFPHGGWIVCIMIPLFVLNFRRIRHHYVIVGRQLSLNGPPPPLKPPASHRVIIPVSGIHKGVLEALNYARSISPNVTAVYIDITPRITKRIIAEWERYGMGVELKILRSPYRSVTRPLLDFVDQESQKKPDGMITVIIPEFVTAKWWQTLLHNQTAIIIRTALAFRRRVVVTSVRYHLAR
jgi:amino acid transporter